VAGPPLTALDESFGHQLVAPRAITQYEDPRWAERTYYLLHVDEGLTINAGRQLLPHAGEWRIFAAAAGFDREYCLRASPPFRRGDDPDAPRVGPLTLDVGRPLEQVRLALDDPDFPLSYDLSFEARSAPVAHEPTLVEKDGAVLTHSMSFFQPGLFSGTVTLDGETRTVERRAGFRDRSWGLRSHDGAPRRGLVLFIAAEFAHQSLYVLLHETGRGRRAYTGGWLMDAGGVVDRVEQADHDLEFAESWLDRGEVRLQMASGATRTLAFETQTRLFLSGVGYSPDPEAKRPGIDRFDTSDPAVSRALEGQTDHGSRFTLDGTEEGHGLVETGRGTHPRYRPEP
jgi:hypothetical protein